jgi:hypothetical protein
MAGLLSCLKSIFVLFLMLVLITLYNSMLPATDMEYENNSVKDDSIDIVATTPAIPEDHIMAPEYNTSIDNAIGPATGTKDTKSIFMLFKNISDDRLKTVACVVNICCEVVTTLVISAGSIALIYMNII